MIPRHHPDPDELMAYASGAGPEWAALVVACHLTYCEECRRELEVLDDVGGALLDSLEAGKAPEAATAGVAALDLATPAKPPKETRLATSEAARGLPRPLHDYFRDDPPKWRFLAPGIRHIPLSFSVGGVPARVVEFKAGYTVPEHAHTGVEMVLVLDGELEDSVTQERFGTGDLSYRDEGSSHSQHITSKDPCVCLVVSAAPIIPATAWGRFLKALTGV